MTALFETNSISQAAKAGNFWLKGTNCDLVAELRSETLLVTFDNLASINERPETPPWGPWLGPRAKALGYSILGVQSHHKDWYRTSEPPEQISGLQASGFFDRFKHIVFTGTSMGGFAALSFAGLVPSARVLAFSPQSTLNRDIAPFESRYPYPHRKFDWQSPEYLDAAEHVGAIASGHVFFDPRIQEDRLHAERLQSPSLTQVRIPFAGHTLIRVIVKADALDHLLTSYPATGELDATFFRLMRNKRQNEHWARPFLAAVAARGDSPLTRRACDILSQQHDHRFARRLRKKLTAPAKAKPAPPVTDRFADPGLEEAAIRRSIPVFINSYNQLTYLRDTVEWFAKHGFENVTVLDNQSEFPALLDYLDSDLLRATAKPVQLPENMGPRRALAEAAKDPDTDSGFIFTDPDLALPQAPAADMLKVMLSAGRRHGFRKVGLALSLDPEIIDLDRVTYNTRTVGQVEKKYWTQAVEDGVFRATTDTTFFLYVPQDGDARRFNDFGLRQAKIPAIRVGREGFVAIHRPWLFNDTIDEAEQAYYFEAAKAHSTFVAAQKTIGTKMNLSDPKGAGSIAGAAPKGKSAASSSGQSDRKMRAAMKTFILEAFAKSCTKPATLIQVGANDGKMADPVFPYLSRDGWQGVMVEPHPIYFSELSALHRERPGLKLFNVAVSTEPGEMNLFHLNEAARDRYPHGLRGCASLNRDRMVDALRRGHRRKKTEIQDDDIAVTTVPVRRLDDVLREAAVAEADILVIDVEGHEIQVLDSFDPAAMGFKMAIVECNGPDVKLEADIAERLNRAGLSVTRFGDDLIGIRDGAIQVPVESISGLLGLPKIGRQ
ncbi:FkbM family methyltransferase [Parasedimentitalea psychrophila]|uniref:FkbM family methyltransferase n=1 Tax=Parasedimentitalea psychrophila TaxID=2997337 RepID=A0A9Y2L085_9RHOB|nr:FkbM family methyltransferase [Parasedimentitalea psychrophila]WIY26306.1 FkbM family methyltransferase [Parasedimentitalea psychrophila]